MRNWRFGVYFSIWAFLMSQFFCHTCARQVPRTDQGNCSVCGNDFLEEVTPDLFQGAGAAEQANVLPNNNNLPNPFQAMFQALGNARVVQIDPATIQNLFGVPQQGQQQQQQQQPGAQDQNPFNFIFGGFAPPGAAAPPHEDDDDDEVDDQAPQQRGEQQERPPHPLNRIQQMLNDMVRNLGGQNARFVQINNPQDIFGNMFQMMGMGNNNAGDFVADANFQNVLNRLFEQSGSQSRAADPETVANLKVDTIGLAEVAANEECPICQEVYKVDEQVKCMPCHHRFHVDCLDPWLRMKNNCPVCRAEIKAEERKDTNNNSPFFQPPPPQARVPEVPEVPETPEPPSPSDSDSEEPPPATKKADTESYDNMYL